MRVIDALSPKPTVTITCESAKLLGVLCQAETDVRAGGPRPVDLRPYGLELNLLPDGRLQARLEFE